MTVDDSEYSSEELMHQVSLAEPYGTLRVHLYHWSLAWRTTTSGHAA
jgi:hypothetical protein